ncbi:FtsW/RodA/SpoVE family cell cycle protein [Velocimicrobium porci]|uniref:Rod shape-determining protein RodA n=1 Tax=Velocimicrobium porci TaxID=2606634 RepID=A0A6L5XZT8_9FIRM|nr:FtsW/RodA/SpoVE family cell cycle protein [Velocimicrobium porci]MSS64380.1 rod shape-determining protein RodA [Velocimicrobium porci]
MFNFKLYNFKRYNFYLIAVVIILGLCSSYFVKQAGGTEFGASNFKKQIIGLIIGLAVAIFVSLVDYHFITQFSLVYYIIGTLLVAGTKFSPLGTDLSTGSYRWLKLPGLNFQPAELMKILLILSLAVFLCKYEDYMDQFRIVIFAGIVMAIPTSFVLVQSDLSSSVVMMFIFAMMIFAAGLSYRIIAPILAVGIPAFLVVFWYIQQPYQKLISDYQQMRIVGFLNPELYDNSIMYQQNYSIQAIASGRLIGKLFMNNASDSRGYRYVDVIESDFIFTVIGEEVGFIGSCVIIGLLATVVIMCLRIANRASDRLGMLIAIGVASMFMFQIFANIGVASRILPNTGLPLPFLSSGISSMLSSMLGIGLVLNVGIQTSRSKYGGFSML